MEPPKPTGPLPVKNLIVTYLKGDTIKTDKEPIALIGDTDYYFIVMIPPINEQDMPKKTIRYVIDRMIKASWEI